MCGITGTWGDVGPRVLDDMTAALIHRGPDDQGRYRSGPIGLGARRLSVVDVAGGAQPFYDESGTICAVVNGEIYNHRELRADLQARGHRFRSACDTEVLVHLYEEHGDRCVELLQGMFAVAIADGERLLLARDRLGIKPLHYSVVPGAVLFASEAKALLRCPQVSSALDMQAFADSRYVGYATGDRTHLDGVRTLLPGHTMVVTRGPDGPITTIRQYYRLDHTTDESITIEEAEEQLLVLLRETVRSHLAADVDVALMLSGGLDSTVLAMLVAEAADGPVTTFGVGDAADGADVVQSARVAAELGLPHHTTLVGVADFIEAIPSYTHAFERPGRLGGLPLHLLHRRVAADVKVCLNGEGADELFGGYVEHLRRGALAATFQRGAAEAGGSPVRPSHRARELAAVLGDARPTVDHLPGLFEHGLRDPLVRDHLDVLDKGSMASGLEIRVPFMDHRLVEFVVSLPVRFKVDSTLGIGKYVLKRAALRAWGDHGPVVESALRRKIGAPAAGARSTAAFAALCERELPEDYLSRHELGTCFSRKSDLLLHELFCELFVAGRGRGTDGLSMLEFLRSRSGRALSASA